MATQDRTSAAKRAPLAPPPLPAFDADREECKARLEGGDDPHYDDLFGLLTLLNGMYAVATVLQRNRIELHAIADCADADADPLDRDVASSLEALQCYMAKRGAEHLDSLWSRYYQGC